MLTNVNEVWAIERSSLEAGVHAALRYASRPGRENQAGATLPDTRHGTRTATVDRIAAIDTLIRMTPEEVITLEWPRLLAALDAVSWLSALIDTRVQQFDLLQQASFEADQLDDRLDVYQRAQQECEIAAKLLERRIADCERGWKERYEEYVAEEQAGRAAYQAAVDGISAQLENCELARRAHVLSDSESRERRAALEKSLMELKREQVCRAPGCSRLNSAGSQYCYEHRCRVAECGLAVAVPPPSRPSGVAVWGEGTPHAADTEASLHAAHDARRMFCGKLHTWRFPPLVPAQPSTAGSGDSTAPQELPHRRGASLRVSPGIAAAVLSAAVIGWLLLVAQTYQPRPTLVKAKTASLDAKPGVIGVNLPADSANKPRVAQSKRAADERIATLIAAYRERRYADAMSLAQELSDEGVDEATQLVGVMYLKGEGVASNPARAEDIFRRLAAKGLADGQFLLAQTLLQADRSAASKSEGRCWLGKAAARGHAEARARLADAPPVLHEPFCG